MFHLLSKVHEGPTSLVYRGLKAGSEEPVILKFPRREPPTSRDLARLRTEFHSLSKVDSAHVIRAHGVEGYQRTQVLVLEDAMGTSLDRQLEREPLRFAPVERFLELALPLCRGLESIHTAGLFHRKMNPSNVVYDEVSGTIRIIDFSHATPQAASVAPVTTLEGHINYVSPEQTGRTSTSLDYRTDFYSLGVMFYELLAGSVPFHAANALELLACHLAANPRPLHEVRPDLPEQLSQIIMKLLGKRPEARYQSAWGLRADLERLLMGEPFVLGSSDVADSFRISSALYGREAHLETLAGTFASTRGPELVLVGGYSGLGKSSLVHSLRAPVAARQGRFVTGKYEQFRRNIPYSGVVQAFTGLARQWLAESEEKLALRREGLAATLGENSRVVTDAIPELALILGPGRDLPEVEQSEAQSRFERTWLRFVRASCSDAEPLVVFLDDLQWADPASLRLVELGLQDDQLGPCLFIGAYRDNEVDSSQALRELVERRPATLIQLEALRLPSIVELLADTLRCDAPTATPLAQLIERKTAGNPLFISEFLRNLYSEGQLWFDSEALRWDWDLERIEKSGYSDSVAELMSVSVQRLPEASRQLLSVAACIGIQFDAELLARLVGRSVEDDLMPLVRQGMLVPLEETEYRFGHDKIQQAAYALLGERECQRLRLSIGRRLLAEGPSPLSRDRLFSIVEHVQQAVELVDTPEERERLARLSLQAAEQARRASAYQSALSYLTLGQALLPEGSGSLAREFAYRTAEAEFLLGNLERCESLIEDALPKLEHPHGIPFYLLLIRRLSVVGDYARALQVGRTALELLGVEMEESEAEAELAGVRGRLEGHAARHILELPTMPEGEHRRVVQVLDRLVPPSFQSGRKSFHEWVFLKAVRLALTFGNTPEVGFCYSWYGNLLNYRFREYRRSYEMGLAALHLCEQFQQTAPLCQCYLTLGAAQAPWVEPLEMANGYLDRCFETGQESGELLFAGFALKHKFFHHFHRGTKLDELLAFHDEALPFLTATQNQLALDTASSTRQLALLLTGGEAGSPEEWDVMALATYRVNRAYVELLLGNWEEAAVWHAEADELLPTIACFVATVTHHFVGSLLAIRRSSPVSDRLKLWADSCPQSYLHKYLLVEAELSRADRLTAMDYYERSATLARQNGYSHDEGLAWELAADFYREWGRELFAQTCLQEAWYAYERWGAKAKLRQLETLHPELSRRLGSTLSQEMGTDLDFQTVQRASRVLTSESLLPGMLALALENSGAERGWLVLSEEAGWRLAATAAVGAAAQARNEPVNLESAEVPGALWRYTARTQEVLLLEDASRNGPFLEDPYVVTTGARSALCLPLVHQQEVTGLLHLENNQVPGAFTARRVELVQTLAAQLSLSLENARYYAQIHRERESRHAQELRSQGLEARKDALVAVLGIASHDLKNPLLAIKMWAGQLGDSGIRDHILTACQRAYGLVGTYLDVAAVETGGSLKLNRRPCDLDELVEREIEFQLHCLAPETRVKTALEWDLVPVCAEVDPERLQQVVGNLVGNALKYCPVGTRIAVTLEREESLVRFAVADEGTGLSADRQVGLFQPFERRTRELSGSGLGLWICRVIVEAHGGRLGVESAPGQGSRFWCELPVPGSPTLR